MSVFDEVIEEIQSGTVSIGSTEKLDNTWMISMSREQVSQTSPAAVVSFLDQARAAYELLAVRHPDKRPLRFYAWVDAQAGQLRFSVSSADRLPFGRRIRFVPEPADIASEFLSSPYLHGIPVSEFSDADHKVETSEPVTDEDRPPLNVYVVGLCYSGQDLG